MNPLFKWVGGKRKYLDIIRGRIPSEINVYHEPFLGAAALLLDLNPRLAMVSDANPFVVNFHKVVQGARGELIDQLGKLIEEYNEESKEERKKSFLNHKHELNQKILRGWSIIDVRVAALFWMLSYTGFNGLFRLNRDGFYNVPVGTCGKKLSLDLEAFWGVSRQIKNVVIRHLDFEIALRDVAEGDFVFLDPPYFNQYDGYTGQQFGVGVHYRLFQCVEKCTAFGVNVMLTVNDDPYLRGLYKGYNIEEMRRVQTVAAKGKDRGIAGDLVITNYKVSGEKDDNS